MDRARAFALHKKQAYFSGIARKPGILDKNCCIAEAELAIRLLAR